LRALRPKIGAEANGRRFSLPVPRCSFAASGKVITGPAMMAAAAVRVMLDGSDAVVDLSTLAQRTIRI